MLAIILTLANAAKPVLIDDTAYLTYAQHIAAHPTDPYGFTMFWYTVPEPAFEVLCPPVLPYWLALGVRLFGVEPVLLKVWLFPFLYLLAWSLADLLRRFGTGSESRFLPLILLSPAILPTINLMLDIPALALGLTSLVLLARATEKRSWGLGVLAGVAAGVAMQTKYTALLVPPTLVWYGITGGQRSKLLRALLAAAVAVVLFAAWEFLLLYQYGRSHFLFHAADQQPAGRAVMQVLIDKAMLVPPLVGHLGCLGIGVGLVAARTLGVSRRMVAVLAAVWTALLMWIVWTPGRWGTISLGAVETTVASTFWQLSGTLVLASVLGCGLGLLTTGKLRLRGESTFLCGWLLMELAGYFALTPFGAARRVIGLVVVSGLLAARASSRVAFLHPERRPDAWLVGFGIAAGVLVAAIDLLDACPERNLARRAAEAAAEVDPAARVWFAGHWGFQFYCEQAGMMPVVPGQSRLLPGDLLVLPIYPDENGFYRPHIGNVPIRPPAENAVELRDLVWTDPVSAQTIPTFYCGIDPVTGRDHPRLRVLVYRVTREWAVSGKP